MLLVNPRLCSVLIFLRLPFQFCFGSVVDPRLSLAAVSLPGNQRRLTAELCDLTDLVRGVVVAGSDGSTNSVAASLSIANGTDIAVAELYLNNIFMNPEIHDIFIRRVGFNLIRVHRRQVRQILDAASEDILLNDLKWPIEYICFGVKPQTPTAHPQAP